MSPCALPVFAHFVPVAALILAAASQLSAQQKAPVPDAQAQDAARKMANEIYGGRFRQAKTVAEKAVLAPEMIDAALTIENGTPDQYILLDIAREVSAVAGEAPTAIRATEELAQRFDVPVAKLKAESLLTAASKATVASQHKAIAEAALSVAAELVDADEFDTAIQLCEAGQSSAKKARESGILKQLAGRADELARQQKAAQEYRDALDVMDSNPAEPAANLTAGRYLCFVKGNWERGIPYLNLGSDAELKNVAVMELRKASSAEEQVAIGDAWWAVAETRQGSERDELRLRAAFWYRQAEPQLAAGLGRLKITQRLAEISKIGRSIPGPSSGPPLAVAPFDERTAKQHQTAWGKHLNLPVEQQNSIGMTFVLIPPGEFDMGCSTEEVASLLQEAKQRKSPQWYIDRIPAEAPKHRVKITRPFCLGVYEVTQAEYERVMGRNQSAFSKTGVSRDRVSGLDTSRFPVEQVSWEDAVEFCRKLSAMSGERSSGRVYRLPTEAEWEYACRAGTTTAFYFGTQLNGREANTNGIYPFGMSTEGPYLGRTTRVGSYPANAFGLCDMPGNVWEWCADWYGDYASTAVDDPTGPTSGSLRVDRGGAYNELAAACRSAKRSGASSGHRTHTLGFRVACTPFAGESPTHPPQPNPSNASTPPTPLPPVSR